MNDDDLDEILQALRRSTGLTAEDQIRVEQLAQRAVLSGRTAAADALFEGLARLNRERGNDFLGDYFALHRADLAVGEGDYPCGRARLEELSPRFGPLEDVPCRSDQLREWEARRSWPNRPATDAPILLTRFYLATGEWLAGNGFFGHARVLLERGESMAAESTSGLVRSCRPRLRVAHAEARYALGELDRAASLLNEATSFVSPVENPGCEVQRLQLLARLANDRGEYDRASESIAAILAICHRGGFSRGILRAGMLLAHTLIGLNQTVRAERALDEIEPIALRTNDANAIARIGWLRRLSRLRGDSPLGRTESLTELWKGPAPRLDPPLLSTSQPDPRDLPPAADFVGFFDDRSLAFLWLLGEGRFDEADRYREELRQIFGPGDSFLIQIRLRSLGALAAYARGDRPEAERAIEELLPVLEELKLLPELRQALRVLWWCRAGDGPEAGRLLERVESLTRSMADRLPPPQRAIYLLNKWEDRERVRAGQVVELDRLRLKAEEAGWWVRWLSRRRYARQLRDYLAETDRERLRVRDEFLRVGTAPTAPPFRHRTVPRGRASLEFEVFPDFTTVTLRTARRLESRVVPLTRLRCRELVARFHLAARSGEGAGGTLDQPATELAEALEFPRVLNRLSVGIDRLEILADDALSGLAFCALRFGGQYLVERFAISYGPADPEPSRRRSRSRKAMAVAVPHGIEPGVDPAFPEGIAELPKTVDECKTVAAWYAARGFADARSNGTKVDRATILRHLGECELAHVACHGVFTADDARASGLVVVTAEGKVEIVSLIDLSNLAGEGVDHLSLSCCWGADNFVLPGQRVIGLADAIRRSGVGSVLVSLWPVADEPARAFSGWFYDYLDRLPRDLALQQAQLDLMRNRLGSPEGSTAHPFYWAGYRLYGRTAPIGFASKERS